MNQYDFIEERYKVFGLHPIVGDKCGCGDPDCQAAGKHPSASNWQHTPHWSDEQLETIEELGQFSTGYGVLVDGLLIVDVDARNGGVDSFHALCKDLDCDLLGESGLAVATGSGQGSMHLYFKHDGTALMQHHDKYKGIDFKSTGFVVGAGSLHKSGNTYEAMHGSPSDISEASASLISLLTKPKTVRAKTSLGTVDVEASQVAEILNHVSPSCDYDTWIRCGMALHHTFSGGGFEIWDEWSSKGDNYCGVDKLQRHWHSFGKSNNPVQLGTLIHYAEANGYQQPVEFEYEHAANSDDITIDLKRPPGLVGELVHWINKTSRYKRENLAVAAALQIVANVGGLRYIDDRDGMTANLITFCVAGSATGKEHIQQCFLECMQAANMIDAVHGGIKSEQEIVRNLTRHQAALYSIDEMGLVLRKIVKSKNASYLEGVIGLIMSTYSKANSFLPVSGDVKESLRAELKNELAACNKAIEENEDATGAIQARAEQITRSLNNISSGIEAPFLSIIGYTTPVTFNDLMDFEMSTNGMLARSMIFDEPETNPRPTKAQRIPLPQTLASRLSSLFQMGDTSIGSERVEYYGEKSPITTTKDADTRLDEILDEFWTIAEDAKDQGLEAIPRRGYELCAKVSFILALSEGVRTIEHVNWAYGIAKDDIARKMRLALSNVTQEDSPADSIAVKIQEILENSENGETKGVLINRCRPHKRQDVEKVIDALVDKKMIKAIEYESKHNKRKTIRYKVLL